MAVSIKDVALRSGVSSGTVSKVLNRTNKTSIPTITRERIQAAATELGYQPNAVARSLRRRRTNSIGFYRYSEFGPLYAHDAFNAAVISGLSTGCHELRHSLVIHAAFAHDKVEDTYLEMANGKVDGLVLVPNVNDPLNDLLAAGNLPVVVIADATPGLPSVTVDDAEGSRLIAEHLAEKGHRYILYRNEGGGFISTERRLRAFLDIAPQFGMQVTLGNLSGRSPEFREHEIALLHSSSPKRPTAVVCWTDDVARYTVKHCREAGLRVPGDIAVAGFNGIPTQCEMAYQLTTIYAPWHHVAEAAVRLVIDIVDGKKVPPETILPVSLVIGDTT